MNNKNEIVFKDIKIDKDYLLSCINEQNISNIKNLWTRVVITFSDYETHYNATTQIKRKFHGRVKINDYISKKFNAAPWNQRSNLTYCRTILYFKKSSDALMFKLSFKEDDYKSRFEIF
jgi:YesN/AraC family two-component response regulator